MRFRTTAGPTLRVTVTPNLAELAEAGALLRIAVVDTNTRK
jgi:hypothetical protein